MGGARTHSGGSESCVSKDPDWTLKTCPICCWNKNIFNWSALSLQPWKDKHVIAVSYQCENTGKAQQAKCACVVKINMREMVVNGAIFHCIDCHLHSIFFPLPMLKYGDLHTYSVVVFISTIELFGFF